MVIHPNKKERIKRIVKLCYISAFLKNEKPLSLILIAPPESSKTHFIVGYKTKYAKVVTDMSYFGLLQLLEDDKKLKHVVIPDFLKVTEKGQNTKKSFISALNAYTEEGIFAINLANKDKKDAKGRVGGVITATTEASFFQNKKAWNSMGFRSRFLCVTWNYSKESIQEILENIANENTRKTKTENLSYKLTEIKSNPKFKKELIQLADTSPRRLKNFQVLLKSIALSNGHEMPTNEDLEELKELSQLINLRFTTI